MIISYVFFIYSGRSKLWITVLSFLKSLNTGKFPEDVMRKMVLVLSHLFKRVYLPANYKRSIDECPTSKVRISLYARIYVTYPYQIVASSFSS